MSSDDAAVREQIIKSTHEWMDAIGRRDRAVLERIIDEEFVIVGWRPNGEFAGHDAYIDDCLRPVVWENARYDSSAWRVRVFEDAAVANCLLECHAEIEGREWGGSFVMTYVWARRNDLWRVIACHTSALQRTSDALPGGTR